MLLRWFRWLFPTAKRPENGQPSNPKIQTRDWFSKYPDFPILGNHKKRRLNSARNLSDRLVAACFLIAEIVAVPVRVEAEVFEHLLGGHLLVGKLRHVGALAGVFHGDAENLPRLVQIQQGVLVQVARLGHGGGLELDVQRVGVLKVADFHNSKSRSKNAL